MPERKVEVGKAIGYGWESVKKNFWYFIGFVLLYMLASGLVSGISSALSRNSFALGSIGQLISVGVSILLTAGSLKIAISYYDGKKLPLGDLFSQSKYFWLDDQ